jgi:hypothetical protein
MSLENFQSEIYLIAIKKMKINMAIAEVSIKHKDAKPNAYQLQALCEYVQLRNL